MYLPGIPWLSCEYGDITWRLSFAPPTRHEMKVAVFGLGYVGTVTAACLAANGHDVWGIDPDESKVAAVSGGHSPVVEPGLDALLTQSVASGALHATCNPTQALERADVSILCVGTPSGAGGETNLTFMNRVVEDLVQSFAVVEDTPPFHTVVIRSTVPPGTVESITNRLQAAFQDLRLDVGVAMCPEFLREGTGIADFYSPPYTVIGSTDPRAGRIGLKSLCLSRQPAPGGTPAYRRSAQVRLQCISCNKDLIRQ